MKKKLLKGLKIGALLLTIGLAVDFVLLMIGILVITAGV